MRTFNGAISGWFDDDAAGKALEGLVQGLNQAVEHLDSEVTPRTPYLTGRLEGSKVVHQATPNTLESGISFHTPYAVRQHELDTPNRTQHVHPAASGKYLEGPFREQQEAMQQLIAANVRRRLDG